jgi:serine/threonine protein kinase
MSTKIGHFEILSELAKSATCTVYKANDPQSGQTVALKAIQLSAFGSHGAELGKCLLEESETTKVLSHPNLTTVFGAEEIDGQFCAAMEYIQGNSVATMLSRKEGFSIWDLLDIGRQVCSGLDHAHSHKIFHRSLEPSKIMCGWDGTVRILGYGLSSVGKFTLQMEGIPSILYYFSPEQVRGEEIDARSNLFSLGAIFYEMVTDRKAFDREDSETLRESIAESTPVPPMQLNPKLHPQLSDLIMKALAKNPGERYQSGKELLEDLEKCKETKPQATKKPAVSAPVAASPNPVRAEPVKTVAQPIVPAAPAAAAAASAPSRPTATVAKSQPVQNHPAQKKIAATLVAAPAQAAQPVAPVARKAAAAAESAESAYYTSDTPQLDSSSQFITSCVKATIDAASHPAASTSSAVLDEPEVETFQVQAAQAQAPKINVDPMMAEGGPSQGGRTSFSEMTELPPLKEIYVAPTPAAQTYEPELDDPAFAGPEQEKPKVQPREAAEKAIKEIKNVPPRLMIYSIAAAAVLILIIAVALVLHVNTLNSDGDTRPTPAESTAPAPAQPSAQAQPVQPTAIAPTQPSAPAEEEAEPAPTHVAVAASRGRNAKKKQSQPVAPIVVPGQMAIDSTPQGAQVQIDGKTDPSWVTPFTLSGLLAGQHTVTVSKAGYSTDTRNIDVVSGSKSFVVSHLSQLMATLSVGSTPAGAAIFVDGKDSGKITPAQVSVDKGQHEVLLRKSGFIDETTNAQFVLGQTFNFSPTLRSLGNVDDIKTVGKMKKLFGGKEAQGMGTVSIKTQPKGAQIAINQHMLEKGSPVDIMLDPGNYIVDISLTGYAPIHKVITVDKGGKAVIDEILQRQ